MNFSLTFFVLAGYFLPGSLLQILFIPVALEWYPRLGTVLERWVEANRIPGLVSAGLGFSLCAVCLGAGLSDTFLFVARALLSAAGRTPESGYRACFCRDPVADVEEAEVYWRIKQLDLDAWAGRLRLTGATGTALFVSAFPYFASSRRSNGEAVALLGWGMWLWFIGCWRVWQYDHRIAGLRRLIEASIREPKPPDVEETPKTLAPSTNGGLTV